MKRLFMVLIIALVFLTVFGSTNIFAGPTNCGCAYYPIWMYETICYWDGIFPFYHCERVIVVIDYKWGCIPCD